ncbi:DUF6219 family protein [Berryella wangjianweii]|nr:DUF6219 family protein [Berryella wangjianweii]
MKSHRFWALASCVCMAMALYTGYAHTKHYRKD